MLGPTHLRKPNTTSRLGEEAVLTAYQPAVARMECYRFYVLPFRIIINRNVGLYLFGKLCKGLRQTFNSYMLENQNDGIFSHQRACKTECTKFCDCRMAFGYAYPAYECFKTVEKNKPEIEQLRFWCQYWILVAVLTVCERVGDTFVSWIPMYSEAKLAFYIYLWFPKTKGTTYVYDSFFRPYLAKHETEIDRNLLELRARAGDIAVLYWQKAASYGQTRVFEILQFVAAQSTSRPRPAQQKQGVGAHQPSVVAVPTRQPSVSVQTSQLVATPEQTQQGVGACQSSVAIPNRQLIATSLEQTQQPPLRTSSTTSTQQPPPLRTSSTTSTQQPPLRTSSTASTQQPPLRTSSTSSTQQQRDPTQEAAIPTTPTAPAAEPPAAVVRAQTAAARQPASEATSLESEAEAAMQIEAVSSLANGSANPPPQETVLEESVRVTRAKLRKKRGTANN
ncbi:hypothetical protein HHK36_010265 [Tetracentron sinense]|uniref:HVA22-like protein n=1 Tax=Tetracentron sinense TaxID=13715 RepID=A0A835DJ27_TETSI|nr:hypothetical protein HHK36_010265 [Tetracentron sinense]